MWHSSDMDWKTWKMRKIPVREKSGNFTQNTGKMRNFYPIYWKSEDILASFCIFLVQVPLLNRFFYLLNSANKTPKKFTGKWKENTGNVRKFVSLKMWETRLSPGHTFIVVWTDSYVMMKGFPHKSKISEGFPGN